MERYLDVRRIIESQMDIEHLLSNLMSKQRIWMFKQQKSRFVNIKSSSADYLSNFKAKQVLINLFESS